MNSGFSASKPRASCSGSASRHRVVPPDVAALGPGDVVLAALDDEHVLDARLALEGAVDGGLEREHLALAPAAVGGDDELRVGVVDAGAQRVGAEAAEDDGVHGAEARDGEHRDDRLGDDRQVDRDAVALADAERGERVGGPLHLGGQLGVGDAAGVARLALPVDGDAVAVAGEHVAVEAVVGDVERAVGEPLRERRVRPVERLGERLVPVQFARLVGPEGEAVGGRTLVEFGAGDAVGDELGVGGKRRVSLSRLSIEFMDVVILVSIRDRAWGSRGGFPGNEFDPIHTVRRLPTGRAESVGERWSGGGRTARVRARTRPLRCPPFGVH